MATGLVGLVIVIRGPVLSTTVDAINAPGNSSDQGDTLPTAS